MIHFKVLARFSLQPRWVALYFYIIHSYWGEWVGKLCHSNKNRYEY